MNIFIYNKNNLNSKIMMRNFNFPGALITVSGVDGSGKTTIIQSIYEFLNSQKIHCEMFKIPFNNCRSLESFRLYAEDHTSVKKGKIDLLSLCLIIDGDTLLNFRTKIIPMLQQGIWVICDRYIFESLAELLANSCSKDDLEVMLKTHSCFPQPDLGIIADVSALESINRIHSRPAEKDYVINLELWEGFVRGYQQVGRDNDLIMINTERTPEESFAILKPKIEQLIQIKRNNF